MNAKEARKLASSIDIGKNNLQYTDIHNGIEKAAKEGKFEIDYYEFLIDVIRNKLIEEGYNIGKTTSFTNEYNTKISW